MRSEPRWLTADEVIRINELAVAATGEPHQLRDRGLLESALARPVNHWHYEAGDDRGVLAAQLLIGLARNHPFAQGNKRTALGAADVFLAANGFRLLYGDDGLADAILDMIERKVSDEAFVADFAETVAKVEVRAPRITKVTVRGRH